MHWFLSAPFIEKPDADTWLAPFVPGTRHTFQPVPAPYQHDRSRRQTNTSQWKDYYSHGAATWSASRQYSNNTGIITVFPQLALTVGLHKRLARRATPLLAWTFNLGSTYGGAKKILARFALQSVDRFIVHSRREITSYSDWLDISPDRFRFVPLQRPVEPINFAEDEARPFVLSMGSARRDYRLFFEVMADLAYPTVVVAGAQALEGLHIPSNVTVHHNLNITQCHELAQKARINVVPIDNSTTASGQVTLIESMMYARPTIATQSIGTEDYVEDGKTALLVPAGDHDSMKLAIRSLWEDQQRRKDLGLAGRKYVEDYLSDAAAGRELALVLDELEDRYQHVR
ncbi:group 1 glycosyl transferase [Sulfuricella sp. T08]|nr:group 1 glycosyl transferase [Sulfuricella sp. T08]